ncbi:MAG: hypothetical protein J6J38_04920 [Lachnospiraceae bacterium]|nr:hypothetical protein [Lachnospiraceae bacterium]
MENIKDFLMGLGIDFGDAVIAAFTTLMSILVTVLTVLITNANTRRINKKNLAVSEEQFKISLDEQRKQFEEELQNQQVFFERNRKSDNERNRISMMPYFQFDESMKIIAKDGKLEFRPCFTNFGNGTAFVRGLKMDDDLTVYKDAKGTVYTASGPMKNHFVQVKHSTTTVFECECAEGANRVVLQLWYEDLMQREYIHRFEFLYDMRFGGEISVLRYYNPECIKDFFEKE